MLMFALMVGILDVWLGVSFRGDAVLTAVSATLLIVAYQMVGVLMQLLARNMALGLSPTGIIVSPAFSYAGVGFPVLAMQGFARAWGAILPLRSYIQILFDQASRGAALLSRPARPLRSPPSWAGTGETETRAKQRPSPGWSGQRRSASHRRSAAGSPDSWSNPDRGFSAASRWRS